MNPWLTGSLQNLNTMQADLWLQPNRPSFPAPRTVTSPIIPITSHPAGPPTHPIPFQERARSQTQTRGGELIRLDWDDSKLSTSTKKSATTMDNTVKFLRENKCCIARSIIFGILLATVIVLFLLLENDVLCATRTFQRAQNEQEKDNEDKWSV